VSNQDVLWGDGPDIDRSSTSPLGGRVGDQDRGSGSPLGNRDQRQPDGKDQGAQLPTPLDPAQLTLAEGFEWKEGGAEQAAEILAEVDAAGGATSQQGAQLLLDRAEVYRQESNTAEWDSIKSEWRDQLGQRFNPAQVKAGGDAVDAMLTQVVPEQDLAAFYEVLGWSGLANHPSVFAVMTALARAFPAGARTGGQSRGQSPPRPARGAAPPRAGVPRDLAGAMYPNLRK
jgi:hypothetical protein